MKMTKIKSSVSTRFSYYTVAVVTAILLIFCIAAISFSSVKTKREIDKRMNNIIEISQAILPSALWNSEKKSIEGFTRGLLKDKSIAFVEIRDYSSTEIAKQPRDKNFSDYEEAHGKYLIKNMEIQYTGQKAGNMMIAIDKSVFYRELKTTIFMIIGLTVCIILALSVTSILVTRVYIFRPLLNLENSATAIAKGHLETHIDIRNKDEIGKLAGALNTMRISIKEHVENLEQKVEERTTQLKKAKEDAEKANAAKDQFLAKVSHEIRTPMNSINGFIQEVLKTSLTQEQKDKLKLVHASSHDLLRIINDILDFSKMEAGEVEIMNVEFQLEDVLEDVKNNFIPLAHHKGIEFTVEKRCDAPVFLIGDDGRLKQVLNNLVNNAFKFTDHGSVTVKVECKDVGQEKVNVNFEVIDTGCGIPGENIQRIFAPYEQIGRYQRKGQKGIGLGLTISKQLVTLMRGTIEVKSEEGKGSIFHFSIPFEKQPEDKPQMRHRIKTAPFIETGTLKGVRVLVVEDDESSQILMKDFLSRAGTKTTIVEDGKKALQEIFSDQYDIVLMDMQIPEIDGYEVTRRIKHVKRFSNIPIIAVTAHAVVGDANKCLDSGADDYMEKPINTDGLILKMKSLVKRSKITPGYPGDTEPVGEPVANEEKEQIIYPIAGINVKAALNRLRISFQTFEKSLKTFALTHKNDVEKIKDALRKNDIMLARGLLHGLRGAAGNLDLVDIQVAATELGTSLREKNAAPEFMINNLDSAVKKFLNSTSSILDVTQEQTTYLLALQETILNRTKLKALIDKIYLLLKKKDYDSLTFIENEAKSISFKETAEHVKIMQEYISIFDYKGALNALLKISEILEIAIEEA